MWKNSGYYFVINCGLNGKEQVLIGLILKVVLTKGEKSLAFGKSVADDFRKTNANGQGYQPMLYKVYSATYAQQGELYSWM
jgi:competence protein ComGF